MYVQQLMVRGGLCDLVVCMNTIAAHVNTCSTQGSSLFCCAGCVISAQSTWSGTGAETERTPGRQRLALLPGTRQVRGDPKTKGLSQAFIWILINKLFCLVKLRFGYTLMEIVVDSTEEAFSQIVRRADGYEDR